MRLGHKVLDDDHECIMSLAAEVEALIAGQAPPADIRAKFIELATHAVLHFRREEAILEAAECPGLDFHKMEHQEIARWFPYLERVLTESHVEVLDAATSQTIAVLDAWIAQHHAQLDYPAIRYVLSKQTTPPLPSASKAGSPG